MDKRLQWFIGVVSLVIIANFLKVGETRTNCIAIAKAVEANNFDTLSDHDEKIAKYIRNVYNFSRYSQAYQLCLSQFSEG